MPKKTSQDNLPAARDEPALPAETKKKPGDALKQYAAEDGERGRSTREILHQDLLSRVYLRLVKSSTGSQPAFDALAGSPKRLVDDLVESVQPTDTLERMLVEQTLWNQARIAHLSLLTSQATDVDSVVSLSEATDRASNTFRRAMLALKEYRQPPRSPANHTSIAQANIAEQQVIQNSDAPAQLTKSDERTENQPCLTAPPATKPALTASPDGGQLPAPSKQKAKPKRPAKSAATA